MKRLFLAFVLLLLAPAEALTDTGQQTATDGWYSWHIVGGEASGKKLYLRKDQGELIGVAVSGENCGFPRRETATDLGEVSTEDTVTMLLDIVMDDQLDMDVRQQALFGLAQTGSERAFDTLDRIIAGG